MAEPVRFSIVTPTHRRTQSLLRMLDALATQDYPFDSFEAIVVADGGNDDILHALGRRQYPYRLRAFSQRQSGPAAARNRGLAEAAEPFVLFIDDDVLPAPSLVRQHAEAHRVPDVVVIGPLLAATAARPSPWTAWEWATLNQQYRAMLAGEWEPTPRQFYTGNASVRLDHVRAVGGFNTQFRRGEDVELAWRLHKRGLRFVFNPLAEGEHLAERSFEAWLKAAHEYGRTDVMLERIRTGGDLPDWVRPEFQYRHPYTKLLTRAVLSQPEIWRPIAASGHVAAVASCRFGWETAAVKVCSALFTAAYWRGVAEQLGRAQALALTAADQAPEAAA
ncbi:MAG TPA: glycosyltransferase [Candidatus Dormibacteraeota bacterium]